MHAKIRKKKVIVIMIANYPLVVTCTIEIYVKIIKH